MKAKDVMTTAVVTVTPATEVQEIATLLLEKHISAVVVVDAAERVVGIVSEGDLLHRVETGTARHRSWWLSLFASTADQAQAYVKSHGRTAADVMSRSVISVSEDTELADIAHLLESRRIKRVPVLRSGRLVGIVARADLLRGLATARGIRPPAPSVDDAGLRDAVLAEMRREAWTSNSQVNVVVTDGIVHLWGMARSDEERNAFRVMAQGVPGVRGVEAHLTAFPAGYGGE